MAQHNFRGMSKHAEVGSEAQDFVRLIRHPSPWISFIVFLGSLSAMPELLGDK